MRGVPRSSVNSKGKHLTGSHQKLSAESYALQFPSALPVKQTIFARSSPSQWRHAVIVYCRLLRPPTTSTTATASALSLTHPTTCTTSAVPTSRQQNAQDYEYYIHWVNLDRRLDCWLGWDDVRLLDDPPPPTDEVIHDIWSDEHLHADMDSDYLREHEEMTKVKTIKSVVIGNHCVECWYYSPYPKEYENLEFLYICEFCLAFFKHASECSIHCSRCTIRYPPGTEIYRDCNMKVAMWEIDGCLCRVYTENLCYLAKLFLDHKTLRHPVHLFLFYIMTEIRDTGYHIVGYFSKEKYSKNNLSCILTLPQHQRKGYGKFLINFSYFLSQKENRRGTPERPLSDLGKATYVAYWTWRVLSSLQKKRTSTIDELADLNYMEANDVLLCLQSSDLLQYHPQSKEPFIFLPEKLEADLALRCGKPPPEIDDENLRWQPYDKYLATFEFSPNC